MSRFLPLLVFILVVGAHAVYWSSMKERLICVVGKSLLPCRLLRLTHAWRLAGFIRRESTGNDEAVDCDRYIAVGQLRLFLSAAKWMLQ